MIKKLTSARQLKINIANNIREIEVLNKDLDNLIAYISPLLKRKKIDAYFVAQCERGVSKFEEIEGQIYSIKYHNIVYYQRLMKQNATLKARCSKDFKKLINAFTSLEHRRDKYDSTKIDEIFLYTPASVGLSDSKYVAEEI